METRLPLAKMAPTNVALLVQHCRAGTADVAKVRIKGKDFDMDARGLVN